MAPSDHIRCLMPGERRVVGWALASPSGTGRLGELLAHTDPDAHRAVLAAFDRLRVPTKRRGAVILAGSAADPYTIDHPALAAYVDSKRPKKKKRD